MITKFRSVSWALALLYVLCVLLMPASRCEPDGTEHAPSKASLDNLESVMSSFWVYVKKPDTLIYQDTIPILLFYKDHNDEIYVKGNMKSDTPAGEKKFHLPETISSGVMHDYFRLPRYISTVQEFKNRLVVKCSRSGDAFVVALPFVEENEPKELQNFGIYSVDVLSAVGNLTECTEVWTVVQAAGG